MEKKLNKLYNECIKELETIGIKIIENKQIGNIDIKIAVRSNKRYGCCKQENPDKSSAKTKIIGRKKYIYYEKFMEHHIEISKWVMELDDDIIKNTIMHELIHCFPNCNNHGKIFKNYAKFINQQLNYNIQTVGNKKEDYKKSNLEYLEQKANYKYKIVCLKCGIMIYRQRLKKDLIKKYRCGKCGGKLKLDV